MSVLDYYRHFANYHDVIRKISCDTSMFYLVLHDRGYCWYRDELNHVGNLRMDK